MSQRTAAQIKRLVKYTGRTKSTIMHDLIAASLPQIDTIIADEDKPNEVLCVSNSCRITPEEAFKIRLVSGLEPKEKKFTPSTVGRLLIEHSLKEEEMEREGNGRT